MQVTTIGLDIAKNVFQVHAIDTAEKVVVRKQLRRSQVVEFFEAMPCGRIWPSLALWLQLVRTGRFSNRDSTTWFDFPLTEMSAGLKN
jgi:hypothetical protein